MTDSDYNPYAPPAIDGPATPNETQLQRHLQRASWCICTMASLFLLYLVVAGPVIAFVELQERPVDVVGLILGLCVFTLFAAYFGIVLRTGVKIADPENFSAHYSAARWFCVLFCACGFPILIPFALFAMYELERYKSLRAARNE